MKQLMETRRTEASAAVETIELRSCLFSLEQVQLQAQKHESLPYE